MKTNKWTILVIFLIIINLLFGGFLLYSITVIEIPNVIASIKIIELNEDELNIEVIIDIDNPNHFSIYIKDFRINSTTIEGLEIGTMNITGGEIEHSSNNTFTNVGNFSFNNYESGPIINKISGEIDLKLYGFIKKKLPINFTIITQFEEILTNINSPNIIINTRISDLNEEGILFIGEIIIFNPNDFQISMNDIKLTVESELDQILGIFNITSSEIESNTYKNLTFNGILSYVTLDADIVNLNLNARVEAQIAGYEKIINVSTKTIIDIPNIQELMLLNESIDFSISGDFKLAIDGILANVGLIVYNPSNIPLQASNIFCTILSVTNNETTELVRNDLKSSLIPPREITKIITDFKISYFDLLVFSNGKIFPDLFLITIEGDFSIEGTNQFIPLSFNGYVDFNLLY